MSAQRISQLTALLQGAGAGWILDEEPEARAQQILNEIDAVEQCYHRTFGRTLDPPLWEQLCTEARGLKPLIQSFASPMTTPIRTMIYCVLDGASIKSLRYVYDAEQKSELAVEIEYPSGERATFTSDDLWDAEVLRHLGLMKASGRPVVDGYYAFRD